ncbi:MAG: NAD(P)H-hydrate dehydratase [Candidatus Odinarchaeum yellowstonii]|uniref:Bifunctional NAD(P)H-hydrate repair enzyme n=1 Tax=Odinarchaeota yellowstonii (strain LCB_4) TaxID=1841599 RepID=A0AAF0IAW7_ODILC|nr:MAG: NAD(P)H-hydrate dehydratase [Candidatus Odinarchaeum yellowstonii]
METITPVEMRELELNSAYIGLTPLMLMENAGRAAYEEIKRRFNVNNSRIIVFCGTGNNGGDGFVVARQLSTHTIVDLVLLGLPERISRREAKINWEIVEKIYQRIRTHIISSTDDLQQIQSIVKSADIIVDAILGTGVKGPLREPLKTAIKMINEAKAKKISIDIPSGMDPGTGEIAGLAVKPDLTITFHKAKKGFLGREKDLGELVVTSISIPREVEHIIGPGDVITSLKRRFFENRKGDFGKLLVIGGSDKYHGAPILSAMSSIRAGVDLVIISTPELIANTIRAHTPNFIVRDYPGRYLTLDSVKYISDLINWADAIVLGPGLGVESETKEAVCKLFTLIKEANKPLVVDADALKVLAENPRILAGSPAVATPHRGEFKLLTGLEIKSSADILDNINEILSKISEFDITFAVKGAVDLVAYKNMFKLDLLGNPGMTVGGIGDVLTGVLGCFLSQGVEPFKAACAAVFITGLSGNLIAEKKGYHFTSAELIEYIPEALEEISAFENNLNISPVDKRVYEVLKSRKNETL